MLKEYKNQGRALSKRVINYVKKVLYLCPDYPKHVNIEISTICNLKCKMCKRENFDFGNKLLPLETYKRIIDGLSKKVELISYGGYGEMLLHPDFFEMARYAKNKGFKTSTTSNGLLLNSDEKIIRLLASGLDELRISIEYITPKQDEIGHAFSKTLFNNIKRLIELRNEKMNMKIGVNSVVHAENVDEVEKIIDVAEKMGVDDVELIRLDTVLNNVQRTLLLEKEKKLYAAIKKSKRKIKVITPADRFEKWRRFYNFGNFYCPRLYEGVHIRVNGAVTPCSFGFSIHDFGNIHKNTMQEIWHNDRLNNLRCAVNNKVCGKCSIHRWGKHIMLD
ncbi:radical SAM protein [Candidatus Woesearchaeota archaeon]|nr:radical SAM protein [Candidatus Woesearchaeota archaeon]